ncbi:unnamed protein product, partial [Ectocarpus sp. 8 AP-2014]
APFLYPRADRPSTAVSINFFRSSKGNNYNNICPPSERTAPLNNTETHVLCRHPSSSDMYNRFASLTDASWARTRPHGWDNTRHTQPAIWEHFCCCVSTP